jgi:hypothetical protein
LGLGTSWCGRDENMTRPQIPMIQQQNKHWNEPDTTKWRPELLKNNILKQSMLWTDPKSFSFMRFCCFCLWNSALSLPWNMNEKDCSHPLAWFPQSDSLDLFSMI